MQFAHARKPLGHAECFSSIDTPSPVGSYTQDIPPRSATTGLPPHLPPLLQHTILNQELPSQVTLPLLPLLIVLETWPYARVQGMNFNHTAGEGGDGFNLLIWRLNYQIEKSPAKLFPCPAALFEQEYHQTKNFLMA